MNRRPAMVHVAAFYLFGSFFLQATLLMAEPDWIPTQGLYFREDTADTPPSRPITQEHVAHPELKMRLRGVANEQLKKSYHEGNRNDPHYIWSGRCTDRWAVSWRKNNSTADLSGSDAFIRMRTKNYDRTLYPIVRTDRGLYVADQGANASENWTVTRIDIQQLKWSPLTSSLERGDETARIELRNVREVGVTDLDRGEGSSACSRLDWIEVWTSAPERSVHAVRAVDGYQVYEGEEPVLFYHIGENSWKKRWKRTNYIHPLHGLDGQVLTEDFPEDHPYHRGIFWAWQQVYVNGERAGDAWHLKKIERTVRQVKVLRNRKPLDLVAFVEWTAPAYKDGKAPFLEEKVVIRVFPREQKKRMIDLRITFRPLAESVRIGGVDNEKELGGFGVRLDVPEDLRFRTPAGTVSAQRTPVSKAPWCTFTGSFGGGPKSGVTVMTHPETPGFPQRWILRDRPSMQNPVFPGRDPVQVPADRPLQLRYRLVLHEGVKVGPLFEQYSR